MLTIALELRVREQLIDVTDEVGSWSVACDGRHVAALSAHHRRAHDSGERRSDSAHRLPRAPRQLVPQAGFRHDEGNADAHIKSSLIGTTQPVLVEDGELVFGRWQAIYFVELDGLGRRQVLARVESQPA